MMIALSVIWSLSLCKAIDSDPESHRLWDILAVLTTVLFFVVLVSKTGL